MNANALATDGKGTFGTLHAGARLRVASWRGARKGPGTIILVQGRAEFIEVYDETIGDLLGRGYAVVAFDLRGQGGSERRTARGGHVARFREYVDDLVAAVRYARQAALPRPYFVLAHSMGGLVALSAADALAGEVERMVLLSPLLELVDLPLPTGLVSAAAATSAMFGFSRGLVASEPVSQVPFERNKLTGDPARYARLCALAEANPHLTTGPPTIGWVRAAMQAMAEVRRKSGRPLAIPTLFVASGNDRIVSTPAIDRFARATPGGGLVLMPAAHHQIFLERDEIRAQFFAALQAFINAASLRHDGRERADARSVRPIRFEHDAVRAVMPVAAHGGVEDGAATAASQGTVPDAAGGEGEGAAPLLDAPPRAERTATTDAPSPNAKGEAAPASAYDAGDKGLWEPSDASDLARAESAGPGASEDHVGSTTSVPRGRPLPSRPGDDGAVKQPGGTDAPGSAALVEASKDAKAVAVDAPDAKGRKQPTDGPTAAPTPTAASAADMAEAHKGARARRAERVLQRLQRNRRLRAGGAEQVEDGDEAAGSGVGDGNRARRAEPGDTAAADAREGDATGNDARDLELGDVESADAFGADGQRPAAQSSAAERPAAHSSAAQRPTREGDGGAVADDRRTAPERTPPQRQPGAAAEKVRTPQAGDQSDFGEAAEVKAPEARPTERAAADETPTVAPVPASPEERTTEAQPGPNVARDDAPVQATRATSVPPRPSAAALTTGEAMAAPHGRQSADARKAPDAVSVPPTPDAVSSGTGARAPTQPSPAPPEEGAKQGEPVGVAAPTAEAQSDGGRGVPSVGDAGNGPAEPPPAVVKPSQPLRYRGATVAQPPSAQRPTDAGGGLRYRGATIPGGTTGAASPSGAAAMRYRGVLINPPVADVAPHRAADTPQTAGEGATEAGSAPPQAPTWRWGWGAARRRRASEEPGTEPAGRPEQGDPSPERGNVDDEGQAPRPSQEPWRPASAADGPAGAEPMTSQRAISASGFGSPADGAQPGMTGNVPGRPNVSRGSADKGSVMADAAPIAEGTIQAAPDSAGLEGGAAEPRATRMQRRRRLSEARRRDSRTTDSARTKQERHGTEPVRSRDPTLPVALDAGLEGGAASVTQAHEPSHGNAHGTRAGPGSAQPSATSHTVRSTADADAIGAIFVSEAGDEGFASGPEPSTERDEGEDRRRAGTGMVATGADDDAAPDQRDVLYVPPIGERGPEGIFARDMLDPFAAPQSERPPAAEGAPRRIDRSKSELRPPPRPVKRQRSGGKAQPRRR